MLRNYIENREPSFHGRDTNRKSFPFEWGIEHLGLSANGDNRDLLSNYVSSALLDSSRFYSHQPTDQYELRQDVLRFPSAIQTPYPENNTVWGRLFDSDKQLGVVVLPQWNCKWDADLTLCKVLQRAGVTTLRLSLPYHHQRQPEHLERAEYLVSSNVGRTLTAIRQAVSDSRRAADWLFASGCQRVGIVGTSVGSCIAFLAFAHDERFSTGVFIHVSSFFADVVWSGLSTKHVRQSLEEAVDLSQLRFLWSPISPFPFIKRLRGTNRRLLMLSGLYDLTFPWELSKHAYEEFDRCQVPYVRAWLPCGHYTMGQFPFNALAGFKIVRFLRQAIPDVPRRPLDRAFSAGTKT